MLKDLMENYYYEGTNILKNKLHIKDQKSLDEYEKQLIVLKSNLLDKLTNVAYGKEFNIDRLNAIHYFLFDDLYDCAGKQRNTEIPNMTIPIVNLKGMKIALEDTMKHFNSSQWNNNQIDEHTKLEGWTKLLNDLWLIQPFVNGNTITCTIFALQFAEKAGLTLDKEYFFENTEYLEDCISLYSVGRKNLLLDFVNNAFSSGNCYLTSNFDIQNFDCKLDKWIEEYKNTEIEPYLQVNRKKIVDELMSYHDLTLEELKEHFDIIVQNLYDREIIIDQKNQIAFCSQERPSLNEHYYIENDIDDDLELE